MSPPWVFWCLLSLDGARTSTLRVQELPISLLLLVNAPTIALWRFLFLKHIHDPSCVCWMEYKIWTRHSRPQTLPLILLSLFFCRSLTKHHCRVSTSFMPCSCHSSTFMQHCVVTAKTCDKEEWAPDRCWTDEFEYCFLLILALEPSLNFLICFCVCFFLHLFPQC